MEHIIGLTSTYLGFGLFSFLMFEADYRKIVKPKFIAYTGFCALVIFAWPWVYHMITRRNFKETGD